MGLEAMAYLIWAMGSLDEKFHEYMICVHITIWELH